MAKKIITTSTSELAALQSPATTDNHSEAPEHQPTPENAPTPRYVFVQLNIRDREHEYYSPWAYPVPEDTTPEQFADKCAQTWYEWDEEEDAPEYDNDTKEYFFDNQCVAVSVERFAEITEKEFKILSKYL